MAARSVLGCVLYGGDPYQPKKPDIAALARVLKQLGVRVVAIQCSEYGNYMLADAKTTTGELSRGENYCFLDAAIIYETEKKKDG
jgi:hypothetical protein